ncbi:FAD-dependent oxidoreductase domain-containing protein 1 [Toxocara canis]|uniref:FAD-dependent oxidoreductase domain-containing protein 1 n=1 Tax=Toxocara canis TaxID=6265 RepID=A0A0B2VUM2_TOXCA|nr:FAD-dependent oxidoreductase domain-containing protein 1 [Toxocara canis]
MLSCGGITQQFCVPEHIEMSMFTTEFLRHAGEHLRILDNDPPDIHFLPMGYMHLACTPEDAERMRNNWKLQVEKGARIAMLNHDELTAKFPFINFDDVILGTYGLENEGCIDAWQLLSAIREKNITLGVQYVKGEVEDNDPPDIHFLPMGYMHLACTPEDAERMRNNWKLQVEKGARIAMLNHDELTAKFPFINFDDVILGTYGLENEGCIDAWQLLSAIREKNITLGVQYVKGEVEGFLFERNHGMRELHGFEDDEVADEMKESHQRIRGVFVRPQMTDASARPIRTHFVVNAAGPWAGKIAEMAGIGKGKGLLAVKLPVEPRKRMVFMVYAPDVPPIDMPALVDPSGVYCLQEEAGNTFICGKLPTKEEDEKINHTNLEVDYDFFYERVWPILAKRVPAFKNIKIKNAWAGYEDVNTFDNSPIIGEHLLYTNMHIMCGFGNRGVQHALAAGRGFSERIFDGAYTSINMRKFDMRRLLKMEKLQETYG